MAAVRRWYVYIVCAVALQSLTWGAIGLLRNLLTLPGRAPVALTAFQIALLAIGLPVYLAHWLQAERLAARDPDERDSPLRRLYLYGTLAALLGPALAQAFDLFARLFGLALGSSPRPIVAPLESSGQVIVRDLLALLVLAVLFAYHRRILERDRAQAPATDEGKLLRRLFVLGFSAAGLTLTILGLDHLVAWLLLHSGLGGVAGPGVSGAARPLSNILLADEFSRLLVGLPVWLGFWGWAQRLHAGGDPAERASALRKFYLYAAIFIAVTTGVTSAAVVLADLFRRLLAVPIQGNLRVPLSLIVGMAVIWSYHSRVLQEDAAEARLTEAEGRGQGDTDTGRQDAAVAAAPGPAQAAGAGPGKAGAIQGDGPAGRPSPHASAASAIRRLYYYLVAGVGLAAFLIGLGGDLSVIIRALDGGFIAPYREQLAIFSAAIIAGLPVWALPWRVVQAAAATAPDGDRAGSDERRSLVRKIYLYFYLTAATLTVLGTGVYVLYRLLSLALGADSPANLAGNVAQNLAFLLIGAAVWLYHGQALRADGRLARLDQTARLAGYRVLVIDVDDGGFAGAVLERLGRELPGLSAAIVHPSSAADGQMACDIAEAQIIVGPWLIAAPGLAGSAPSAITPELAAMVGASPAAKVLVPRALDGWHWAGVEGLDGDGLARSAARATRQLIEGGELAPARLSTGTIVGLTAAALAGLPALALLLSLVMSLIDRN